MRLLLVLLLSTICSAQSVDRVAHAIAKAEGFYTSSCALPKRLHNPGDLKALRGFRYPGQVGIGKGGHAHFKNDSAGWAALEHQLDKMIAGESTKYSVNMTLQEFGRQYATGRTWSRNVAHNLGVNPETYLWEVLNIPPKLEIK